MAVITGEFTRALTARREAHGNMNPSSFGPYTGGSSAGGGGGGWAGVGLAAASAISSIGGALLSAKAMKMQARAEQAAAEYNALLAEIEARAESARQRHIARRTLSSQFTQMAGKSGVVAL